MSRRVINTEAFLEYLKQSSELCKEREKEEAADGNYASAIEHRSDYYLYDYLIRIITVAEDAHLPDWIDVIDDNGANGADLAEDDLK